MSGLPLIPGTLRGYRAWSGHIGDSFSPLTVGNSLSDFCWKPGINTAQCFRLTHPSDRRERYHYVDKPGVGSSVFSPQVDLEAPVPHWDCSCGFYAYETPRALLEDASWMGGMSSRYYIGVVEMWGHVVMHRKGYRAQHARVVAVSNQDWWDTPHECNFGVPHYDNAPSMFRDYPPGGDLL